MQRKRSSPPSPSSESDGVDLIPQRKRTKWARLLLRELYDLGFHDTAAVLEREASVQLRSQGMTTLHHLVATHHWDEALNLVTTAGAIRMKSHRATREVAFLLLQRKFIELLLHDQLPQALWTFQNEIVPSYAPTETEVAQLAALLLCQDADEMQQCAVRPWQDDELQAQLEACVSPEEMIPQGALRKLVHNEQLHVPLAQMTGKVIGHCFETQPCHFDDVWALAFSPDGQNLASASKDGGVVLWGITWTEPPLAATPQGEVVRVLKQVDGRPDCLAWSPSSHVLLSSSSRSSTMQLWNRSTGECDHSVHHPNGNVTSVHWLADGEHFVSGSADHSIVLWNARDSSIAYQWSGRRVVDLVAHPRDNHVFVLTSTHEVRVYDVDRKTDALVMETKDLVSCLAISPCGKFLLANVMNHQQLACVDLATGCTVAEYKGLRELRYVLRPCFVGAQSELVVAGSEDGKVLVWQRESGKRVAELAKHAGVVNVVVRHPIHAHVVATASDDRTVRLWALESVDERV